MKKVVLVTLVLTLCAAGAWADHPSGWGVGGVWGSWRNWKTDYYDKFHNDFGLSLKAPQLPVYWGIYLNLDSYGGGVDYFGINLTGDYYLIDKPLVPEIFMGWYAGVGGRLGLGMISGNGFSSTSLFLGARGVIGLDWQFPIGGSVDAIEVFLDVAPSLGIDLYFGDEDDSSRFPAGGWGWDLGVRFWI